jgi:shikimate dehydrogenase
MNKFAVFGNPIKHSLSPQIHQDFALQFEMKIEYEKILASDFKSSALNFIENDGVGFNITVPFKEDAFNFVDSADESAKTAKAVNTILVKDNQTIGYNTDGIGLVNDLTKNIGIDLDDKVILIIGAGGASRGIIPTILKQNPKRVMIANRTASKAQQLANEFSNLGKTCGFGLEKVKNEPVDVVINATSSSISGEFPDIASGCVKNAICYDLMYSKTNTPFMDFAENNDAKKVFDGWGMLVEQAAKAFEIWTNKKPNTSNLITNRI